MQSRSFEINAMQEAMKNAKFVDFPRATSHMFLLSLNRAGSTHRAWQELPRHLRRRAASHNVRRVPLRLRDKSRSEVRSDFLYTYTTFYLIILLEMGSMRRKALGRSLPKRGKDRRELRTDAFARRQSMLYLRETFGPWLTCLFDSRG
jgi:ribonuclease P/MRP protein subunit POP1